MKTLASKTPTVNVNGVLVAMFYSSRNQLVKTYLRKSDDKYRFFGGITGFAKSASNLGSSGRRKVGPVVPRLHH